MECNAWSKVTLLSSEDIIAFENKQSQVVFYDINRKCIVAQSKELKKIEVPIYLYANEPVTHNTAWSISGDILFM